MCLAYLTQQTQVGIQSWVREGCVVGASTELQAYLLPTGREMHTAQTKPG